MRRHGMELKHLPGDWVSKSWFGTDGCFGDFMREVTIVSKTALKSKTGLSKTLRRNVVYVHCNCIDICVVLVCNTYRFKTITGVNVHFRKMNHCRQFLKMKFTEAVCL